MKVYADTNVFTYAAGGGVATPAQRRSSRELLRLGRRGRVEVVVSPVTLFEIDETPTRWIRRQSVSWLKMSKPTILPVNWSAQVERLSELYRVRGAVPPAQIEDARHLAWTTMAGADVLTSWNRTHLVRLKTRHLVAIINPELGYRGVAVEFPDEVLREIEKP